MLPNIAVLAKLTFYMDMPNGKCKVTLLGEERVNAFDFQMLDGENIYTCKYTNMNEVIERDNNLKNLIIKSLRKYINALPYVSNSVLSKIDLIDNLNDLTDAIVSLLPFDNDKKISYVYENDSIKRSKMLLKDMSLDLKYARLEEKIDKEVKESLDKNQRDYYLREKIKTIRKELGDDSDDSTDKLKNSVKKLKAPKNIKERASYELKRYIGSNINSPDSSVIRDYLDWLLNIPWNKYTKDNNDFEDVSRILNESHYGLTNVKERILEYLAVKQNTNSLKEVQ